MYKCICLYVYLLLLPAHLLQKLLRVYEKQKSFSSCAGWSTLMIHISKKHQIFCTEKSAKSSESPLGSQHQLCALWSDVFLSSNALAFFSLYPSLPCPLSSWPGSLFPLSEKSPWLLPGPYPLFCIARILLMVGCTSQGSVFSKLCLFLLASLLSPSLGWEEHIQHEASHTKVNRTGASYSTN